MRLLRGTLTGNEHHLHRSMDEAQSTLPGWPQHINPMEGENPPTGVIGRRHFIP